MRVRRETPAACPLPLLLQFVIAGGSSVRGPCRKSSTHGSGREGGFLCAQPVAMPRAIAPLLLLAVWAAGAAAAGASVVGGPHTFAIKDDQLLLDGKPMQVISGR